jgi:hypothetical protein
VVPPDSPYAAHCTRCTHCTLRTHQRLTTRLSAPRPLRTRRHRPPACAAISTASRTCCAAFPFLLRLPPRLRHSVAAPEKGRNQGGSPPPSDLSPSPPWHTTALHGLHRHIRPRTRYAPETPETPSPRRVIGIRASPIHKPSAFPSTVAATYSHPSQTTHHAPTADIAPPPEHRPRFTTSLVTHSLPEGSVLPARTYLDIT